MGLRRADSGTARVLGLDPVADGPELNDRAAAVAEAFDRGLLTPGSR